MANYNIQMNRFNGTDYDTLMPKNTITGTTDPTTSTKGFIGQFYANISTNPAKMWQCVGESGGVYSWKEIIDVDAFSKEETLTLETAALYGLGADAVPDEVLALIKQLLDEKSKLAAGTYVGTGTFGSANQNSLTFNFTPKIVIISGNSGASETKIIILPRTTYPVCSFGTGAISTNCFCSIGATTTWYSTGNANVQGNANGVTYSYLALG